MPFNGSGVYTPPGTDFPAVPSTLIESNKYNAVVNDQSTALSTCVTKDGQTTITANLPMSGYKHTNVAAGATRTDYASMANLQDRTTNYVATVGGTADAITLTPLPAIAAYAAGQQFSFIASGANTTAVTVNVSGLGAKAITRNGAVALVAGDIPQNALAIIEYDGTQFQLINTFSLSSLTMAPNRHLGRKTAGTGPVEEIRGGWLLIDEQTASNSATLDFTVGIDNTYDLYMLEFDLKPETDDVQLLMRVGTGAGPTWQDGTGAYSFGYRLEGPGSGVDYNGTDTSIPLSQVGGGGSGVGNASGEHATGEVHFINPETGICHFRLSGVFNRPDSSGSSIVGFGAWGSTTAITALRLFFSSGNIASGTARLYAMRK